MALGHQQLRPKRAGRSELGQPLTFIRDYSSKDKVPEGHVFVCSKSSFMENAFYPLMNITFAKER